MVCQSTIQSARLFVSGWALGWQVDWPVGRWFDQLVSQYFHWYVSQMAGQQFCQPVLGGYVACSVGWSAGWQVHRPVVWQVGWSASRQVSQLAGRPVHQ